MEKAICEMGGLDFVRNTLQVESTECTRTFPFNPHSASSILNTESPRFVWFYWGGFLKQIGTKPVYRIKHCFHNDTFNVVLVKPTYYVREPLFSFDPQ